MVLAGYDLLGRHSLTISFYILNLEKRQFSNDLYKSYLFVFDLVFIVFRITWWPSPGKELSPWLSACVIFILYRLNCMCSFPVRCLGQDVEFDRIGP